MQGRFFMRRIFLLILLCYSAISAAHFSNMIVFGDSLSDGGNFPESQKIWWNPAAEKTVENAVAQLYVPFTNPVDTRSTQTAWPVLDEHYLSKQVLIENQKSPRKYRSISWPQFFLMFAEKSQLTKSAIIAPSDLLNTRQIPSQLSFNYAWGYATSTKHCVNPYDYAITHCTAHSINQARKQYLLDPSDHHYLNLEIPGLFEQVHLFQKDYREHKVSVDQHTLYVFWTGGNDLIIASNALRKRGNPFPAIKFLFGATANHILKNISLLMEGLPKDQRPKTIYVFNLFNPGLTPGFYHTPLGGIADFSVKCFNFWLKWESKFFNLFSDTKIIILPAYDWYHSSSKEAVFKTHLGEACQLKGGNYERADVIPESNCAGFMFWNAVHPSTPMNTIAANAFFKYLHLKRTTNEVFA